MMLYVVIAFLWLSAFLYLIMAGADFGAGILELFSASKNRQAIRQTAYRVMGPIWEANHMWLVIIVVILFVGFPRIYSSLSVYLHIPLLMVLFGIIARGTSFTFRNYDAVNDGLEKVDTRIFKYACILTPFFLGVIAGSIVSRRIDPKGADFVSLYIFDWFNPLALATGFFMVALFGFLAAIYLIGEADETELVKYCRHFAMAMNLLMFLLAVFVLFTAKREGLIGPSVIGRHPLLSIFGLILLPLFNLLLWLNIIKTRYKAVRVFAGGIVFSLLAVFSHNLKGNVMYFKTGEPLSVLLNHSPAETIGMLGWALLVGGLFIIPALFYLVWSFDKKTGTL